jgi:predicted O-linked N-acetylglucosamine transferase (SPINDLY family)
MDSLAVSPAPQAQPDAASGVAQGLGDLAAARSGRMELVDLLERANRLNHHGEPETAAQLYESWITHTDSPLRHVACFNWGTVLSALNRTADAERAYARALEFKPDFIQARLNLGHQAERLGRADEALSHWRQVIEQTASAGTDVLDLRLHALNNSARLLEVQRRFDEAERFMVMSLVHKPSQREVVQHYVHIRQKQCKWPLYEPVGDVTLNQMLVGTSPLAMLSASDDPALQLLVAERFVHTRVPKPPATPLYRVKPQREARIKVGYLSSDLCLHAMGLLIPELFELHDRSRFEVHGFCWTAEDRSAERKRLLAALDHHLPIGKLDDAQAAQRIADAGIDVLVDLHGITNGARPAIVGMRPAPVQVSYLGFPGTTALPGVDWVIADPFVMPSELLPYMSERPMMVPHCYQVSDRKREVAATPRRADCGLPDDAFVFCSFNNNFKFTEPVFACWMRVLAHVPHSVLWLLADNEWARENMLRQADAHGIARERLVFAPRVGPPAYMARFKLADLVLDTFPYNAGTTASDALWMGTPILTCAGRTYISRMAGSLLTSVGLPDLVTTSLAEYERLAVQLGREPMRIASYKRYLAEHGRQSRLFDVPALVRDIEAGFERLVDAHRRASGVP